MNYEELIPEFVDGSMDSSMEDALFRELANNDELRMELKQEMAIKYAVRQDKTAFLPTADSTISLFDKLGIALATTPAPVKTGLWGSLTNLKGTALSYLAVGFVCTIATMLLLEWGNIFSTNNNNIANNSSSIPIVSSIESENSSAPIAKIDTVVVEKSKVNNKFFFTTDLDKLSASDRLKLQSLYNKIEELENNAELLASNSAIRDDKFRKVENALSSKIDNLKQEIAVLKLSNPDNLPSVLKQNFNELPGNNNSLVTDFSPMSNPIINTNEEHEQYSATENLFSLEFNGYTANHSNNTRINPSEIQGFNNTSIALYWLPSKYFSLGLSYRRENFYQKFNFNILEEGNVIPVSVEQQPNFVTYGVQAKHLMNYLFTNVPLVPFMQFNAETNNAGFVYRFGLGTQIDLNNSTYFNLGYEYSNLIFTQSKNSFNSNKTSFIFGMGVRF